MVLKLGMGSVAAFVIATTGTAAFAFILGFTAGTEEMKFLIILIVCMLASVGIKILFNSPLGRSFIAIRDNEMAANCLGVNSLLTKSIAFAISGALCGAAGALYAFLSGYLSYQTFTYQQSTMYLIMLG